MSIKEVYKEDAVDTFEEEGIEGDIEDVFSEAGLDSLDSD